MYRMFSSYGGDVLDKFLNIDTSKVTNMKEMWSSGGKGNAKFTTPTRQAPKFAQPGRKGESLEIVLELKLLADVGLVGFPNVGKSSLLSVISAAKPKIDNYHFTTLQPNLGVVRVADEMSFVVADIPGLIEGASAGAGLGHEFLKHVERTRLLIHVIDVSGFEGRDPVEDYYLINEELNSYNLSLGDKEQIVFANKMDLPGAEEGLEKLKAELEPKGIKIFDGSVATTRNLEPMLYYVWERLKANPVKYETYDEEYVEVETIAEPITVERIGNDYIVEGDEIEYVLNSINFEDNESIKYFQDMLRKKGIVDRLEALGIQEGDPVFICDMEFEFIP